MKKSNISKIISFLLAFVMLLTPLLGCISSAAEVTQNCPLVTVHGFMAKDIYENPDDPDSKILWPPSTDDILATVKDCIPALAKFFVTWNWDTLGEETLPVVKRLLGPVTNADDGTVKDNSGVRFTYPDENTVTKNGTYEFCYDWRLDPFIIASQLNDYINYILRCSGSTKVAISCHSLGGVITTTYLSVYGNQKIKAVCYNASATFGETYNGELMTGKMSLNGDAINEYMKYAFDGNEYQYLLTGIFDMLNAAGILELTCKFGNYITEKMFDYAVPQVVVPLFGNWLTVWAMVPDSYITEATNYVFNTVYKKSNVDRTAILAKIQNYNNTVRSARTNTLLSLNQNANVVVLSRYGYSSLPITISWNSYGDGNVDAKYSSFGATTSNYGETLSDSYISGKEQKYISPDKTIDASTCLFPEQTWFIKNMKHSGSDGNLDEIIKTLLFTDAQPTVSTYTEYPQFMIYDTQNDIVTADSGTEIELSGWDKFVAAIKELFNMFKTMLSSVFGK